MPHLRFFCLLLIAAFAGFATLQVSAHSGAKGIVKQRMEMMKDIGVKMKALGAMAKGSVPFDREEAAAAARTIAGHGAEIPNMFPHGSMEAPSEALEVIWTDWQKFEGVAMDLSKSAEIFADAAAGAPSMQFLIPQFTDIAATCKSCHKTFRTKKN